MVTESELDAMGSKGDADEYEGEIESGLFDGAVKRESESYLSDGAPFVPLAMLIWSPVFKAWLE